MSYLARLLSHPRTLYVLAGILALLLTSARLPAQPVPATSPADVPSGVPLLPWSKARGVSLVRAGENKQTVKVAESDGKSVLAVEWRDTTAKPMAEVIVDAKPALHLFGSGVVLIIPVNADACPGLTGIGIRVNDGQGETFQWGGSLDPKQHGWQDVRIVLDPARHGGNWGGGPAGKGKVDEPVRLGSLVISATKPVPAGARVLIGEIRRNVFDASRISQSVLLQQLAATPTGERKTMIFTPSDPRAISFKVTHKGELPVNGRFAVDATAFNGQKVRWPGPSLSVPPGQSSEVTVDAQFPRLGWYELALLALSEDGKTTVEIGKTMAANMEPAGLRALPPPDGFWFGIDARLGGKKDDWVPQVCAQAGFDFIRTGGWNGHSGPGRFNWDSHRTLMDMIRQAGLRPLESITFTPKWAVLPKYAGSKIDPSRLPPREDALRDYIAGLVAVDREYGVVHYDLWNEPDLSGFYKGTTAEYLDFMRVAYDELKKQQPNAIVLTGGVASLDGHGGHSLNPDLIKAMIVDGQDHYDAISLHLHGTFKGFQSQIDGPLADMRGQLRTAKPLFFTETGVSQTDRKSAANELVKKIIFARARGAIGFTTFVFNLSSEHGFSLMNPGPSYEPFPALPAHNQLVKLMRGNRFTRQIDLGPGYWMFAFGDDRDSLLAAWDEDAPSAGEVAAVGVPPGSVVELVDLMGNAVTMQPVDGIVPLTLTKEVQYLRVKGGMAEVLGALAGFHESPIAQPGEKTTAVAFLNNPFNREAEFVLIWTNHDGKAAEQHLRVAARAGAEAKFETAVPASRDGGHLGIQLSYEITGTPLRGKTSVSINAAQRIPRGDHTKREPDFVMLGEENIQNANHADPTRAAYIWKGRQDLSSRVWLGLEDERLLLTVQVTDDVHHQTEEPANMWRADGIQAAFSIPGRSGQWSIGLARDDGGKNLTYAWSVPAGLSPDYARRIVLDTTRTGSTTTYRAKLPLDGFGADAAYLRTHAIGFNLIVNDDDHDGGGRKGFAFIAKGLGTGAMVPEEWPRITFE